MSKEIKSTYNANIMNVVAKHQRKLQSEVGTNWWYEKSKTFRVFTLLSEICFYFTLLWNIVIILSYSMILTRHANTQNWANERALVSNALGSFVAGTVIIIAAYIFKKIGRRSQIKGNIDSYKYMFISLIGFAFGCILLCITAYNVLVTANIDNIYAEAVDASTPFKIYMELLCLHILPLFIMLLASVLFFTMQRCDSKEKQQIYANITEALYKDFIKENPSYSSEQWEEHLNNYKGLDLEERMPTRSEKSRKRKKIKNDQ